MNTTETLAAAAQDMLFFVAAIMHQTGLDPAETSLTLGGPEPRKLTLQQCATALADAIVDARA